MMYVCIDENNNNNNVWCIQTGNRAVAMQERGKWKTENGKTG